jgi:hypothetical protein
MRAPSVVLGTRTTGRKTRMGAPAAAARTPIAGPFEQIGELVLLTGRTIVSAVRPPYPYGEEFIGQFMFALQLCRASSP